MKGLITSTERAMIHNVVDFSGVKVRDVMLPAAKVVALQPNASIRKRWSSRLLAILIVCRWSHREANPLD